MIDLRRRSFLFGAAATLILPPKRTFFILEPPKLVVAQGLILPGGKLFDLPDPQSESIGRKLVNGTYLMRDLPRWVVLDQRWYDGMVTAQKDLPDPPREPVRDYYA